MTYRPKPQQPHGHENKCPCHECDAWAYDLIFWEEEMHNAGIDAYSHVHETLQPGETVGDTGRIVILCTQWQTYEPGDCFAVWTALCYDPHAYHRYAIWDVIARPEGWSAGNGLYTNSLKEAETMYTERGGKPFNWRELYREGVICEYCGQSFVGDMAQYDKSNHKRTCPEKRYLGGELTIETAENPAKLLGLD